MSHRSPDKGVRGPWAAAILIGLAASFSLGGYEFLRSPTNTIYKAVFGKETLAMGMAFIPLAVAALVYVYARLLSWLGARKTLFVSSVGSALIIAGLQFLHDRGLTSAAAVLYLFRWAYVVLLVEQYWSFLNSTLGKGAAYRLNGPICGVASIGSVAAGIIGAQLTSRFGTTGMVYLAALSTLPAAFFSDYAYRLYGEPTDKPKTLAAGLGHLGLGLFRRNPLLVLLLGIVVATQAVAAFVTLSFQGELQDAMPDPDLQTAWSYTYFAWINGIAAILQFFVAPLVMAFTRPGIVHVAIPSVHLVVLGLYLRQPDLMMAAFAHGAFKCLDYSLFRAAKEVLYIPMPFDARYRAKEIIDVFGYRFSKGITSGVVALLERAGFAFTEVTHGIGALLATLAWVACALPLGRYYRNLGDRASVAGGSETEQSST